MNLIAGIEVKTLIVGFLIVALVWALNQLFQAGKLAKHPIVIRFVDRLPHSRLINNNIEPGEILELQDELTRYDRMYLTWTIRQAISFAISRQINTVDRKNHMTINDVDQLGGLEFEFFLKKLFEGKGYQVELTRGSGDQGVDLILYQGRRKIAVQAKRYSPSQRVGVTAVQEVCTGKIFYDCTEAYVITSSYYTTPASVLAKKVGVSLINRDQLIRLLSDSYSSIL
ncbi:restriction endonuclease [Paenibacillus peoriae]|uniref:restriction endonuclease n=1 Tax=Paenibacillus peoriae TaxID=59893 RepID=UPI001CC213E6|nr:restriction endonuclease [Paenibacillus peoriae]